MFIRIDVAIVGEHVDQNYRDKKNAMDKSLYISFNEYFEILERKANNPGNFLNPKICSRIKEMLKIRAGGWNKAVKLMLGNNQLPESNKRTHLNENVTIYISTVNLNIFINEIQINTTASMFALLSRKI